MREKILATKAALKSLATDIRTAKSQRKNVPNGYIPHLLSMQQKYRSMHIAYCLVRGRKLSEIEPFCRNPAPKSQVCRYYSDITGNPLPEDI